LTTLDDFAAFYRAHFPFAWRVLRRLGAHDDELPDLLQEVFLVAHRKLPEFEGRSRVTTWLFSICHNVFRGARRRAKHRLSSDSQPGEPLALAAPPREDFFSARELLQRLPEQQRVVFVLFELEGMSGDEIAAELSIPVGTVRSRLRLARESFRRELAEQTPNREEAECSHV
jgi:RNA polymerase sigma-70 factor, ECF subfamily